MRHLELYVLPAGMSLSSRKGQDPSKRASGKHFVRHHPIVLLISTKRYANTDYVVVRSVSHNPETKKVASYDIMCQWSINFKRRLSDFPLEGAERLDQQIVARVVPKFHLAAHKEDCRINFSLNYEPGVGRSDMEGPERTWFGLQGGGSTKDQGPGYWSDAMDDKFGHWNWSKLIRLGRLVLFCFVCTINSLLCLGPLLAKKYVAALTQSAMHSDEFAALCIDVPKDTRDLWIKRITSWEGNRSLPNPYFNQSSGTSGGLYYSHPNPVPPGPSELEIRRRLTLEEEEGEVTSTMMDSSDKFTTTKYLLHGLDLEEQQYCLPALRSFVELTAQQIQITSCTHIDNFRPTSHLCH